VTANNVVEFPKVNRKLAEMTLGVQVARLKRNEINYVEEKVREFDADLRVELAEYGLDFSKFQDRADYLFLINCVSAIFCRQHGLKHPMHEILNTARKSEVLVDEDGEPLIVFGPTEMEITTPETEIEYDEDTEPGVA
jgi:hypothetical protein